MEEKMINYFKKKAISVFDATNLKLSIFVNVGVGLITFFTTKLFGAKGLVSVLICASVILLFGSIIQVSRKEKNMKSILFYIIGTFLSIFATIVVESLNKYSMANNIEMIANTIKISICVIALSFDIPGGFYIINKENPKGKKLILSLCMLYFTIMAIGVIMFFSSKGV
jgi:hypothetical protein